MQSHQIPSSLKIDALLREGADNNTQKITTVEEEKKEAPKPIVYSLFFNVDETIVTKIIAMEATEKSLLENNPLLFEHIDKNLIELKPNKLVFKSLSNRQDHGTDQINAERYHPKPLYCVPIFKMLERYFTQKNTEKKYSVRHSDYLTADSYSMLPPGTTFARMVHEFENSLKEEKEKEEFPSLHSITRYKSLFDPLKITTMYAHVHEVASYPEHANHTIFIDYFDDRANIMEEMDTFYNKHSYLLPDNVTLRIYSHIHYRTNGHKTQLALEYTIKGTGKIDYNFHHNLLEMVTCFNVSTDWFTRLSLRYESPENDFFNPEKFQYKKFAKRRGSQLIPNIQQNNECYFRLLKEAFHKHHLYFGLMVLYYGKVTPLAEVPPETEITDIIDFLRYLLHWEAETIDLVNLNKIKQLCDKYQSRKEYSSLFHIGRHFQDITTDKIKERSIQLQQHSSSTKQTAADLLCARLEELFHHERSEAKTDKISDDLLSPLTEFETSDTEPAMEVSKTLTQSSSRENKSIIPDKIDTALDHTKITQQSKKLATELSKDTQIKQPPTFTFSVYRF